jgi:hypothetical protein
MFSCRPRNIAYPAGAAVCQLAFEQKADLFGPCLHALTIFFDPARALGPLRDHVLDFVFSNFNAFTRFTLAVLGYHSAWGTRRFLAMKGPENQAEVIGQLKSDCERIRY